MAAKIMAVRWSLMAFAVSATVGSGLFMSGALYYFRKQGGEIRPLLMATSFVILLAGLVIHITGLGSPSNALGMLSHITAGFSMATIGAALLCAVALIAAFNATGSKKVPLVVLVLGIILSLCIYYGLSVVFTKASRPALHHWFVPLYIVSAAAMTGCYGNLLFRKPFTPGGAIRLLSLVLVAVALVGFYINLSSIGNADRYLNINLINGSVAGWFYGGAILAGLAIPLAAEFAMRFGKAGKFAAFAGWLGAIAGSISFFTIINIV